jgi:hypothetical protein
MLTPELIAALLASPVLTSIAGLFAKRWNDRRTRALQGESTAFTRLEQENVRAAERIRDLEKRVKELEASEDTMRDERNRARTDAAYWRGKREGAEANPQ